MSTKPPPPSAIEQTRSQALKEFRGLLHEALASAVADEAVPEAFREAINWEKLIDQTEAKLVETWRQRFDANGRLVPQKGMGPLSLLAHDEHEQQVLAEMFINEVTNKDRERLEQLQQLLAAIGVEGWKSESDNPLGPSVWVDSVRSGMQQFRCTPEERSWLLQRLVPLLLARMGNFYGTLNTRISKISGIPLHTLVGRRGLPAPAASAAVEEAFGHDLVENTSGNRPTAADLQDDGDDGNTDVLERLFSLMSARRGGGPMVPGMMPGMMPGMAPGMVQGTTAGVAPAAWGAPVGGVPMGPGYGYQMPGGQYPAAGGAVGYEGGGVPMGAPAGPMPVWSDSDLMSVLNMMQSSYAAPAVPANAAAGVSTARLFEAITAAAGQMGLAGGVQSMPGPAQDMMELVNMLFEALLDGRRLDERARSQLSRLVIPYARVALLDRRMFMQSRHPARRVLNQLVEALETASVDAPQFRDLRELAFSSIERIIAEFKDDLAVFESLDRTLAEALSDRRRSAEIAERRMADAEKGRERRAMAMATVAAQLQQAVRKLPLPEPVWQFISGPWQHHQTILVLREGADGDQAQANLALMRELVKACRLGGDGVDLATLRPAFEAVFASSGQPPEDVDALLKEISSAIADPMAPRAQATPGEVEPAAALAPAITPTPVAKPAPAAEPMLGHDAADVEAKLLAEIASFVADDDSIPKASISFDEEAASEAPAAQEIIGVDLSSLDAAPAATPEEAQPEESAAALDVVETTPAHSIPLALAAESAQVSVDLVDRYRKLKVGDWLDLVNEDGRITAARISWTSPISGRHMLSNRRGQRLMVCSVEELAKMEVEGQVHIRANDAAFDVALNALTDRLARSGIALAPR